jgi:hypothetical protein
MTVRLLKIYFVIKKITYNFVIMKSLNQQWWWHTNPEGL